MLDRSSEDDRDGITTTAGVALQEILKWEKEQKDVMFWEKLGRIPFMLDRLTPKAVQEKIGSALNEVGGFIQSGGKHLVREKSVMNVLAQARIGRSECGFRPFRKVRSGGIH